MASSMDAMIHRAASYRSPASALPALPSRLCTGHRIPCVLSHNNRVIVRCNSNHRLAAQPPARHVPGEGVCSHDVRDHQNREETEPTNISAAPGEANQEGRNSWVRKWILPGCAALVLTASIALPPAQAADALKTCSCLLKNCRGEFARCLSDVKCASNIACLQTCNGRPDETECQIGCGDLFENAAVDEFNLCAVTTGGCVPQKPDANLYPIPPPSALVPTFSPRQFSGRWFITSGLNRTFDTFDCQEHVFTATDTRMEGSLKWRIPTPDGGFFTRSAVQKFVQDPKKPAVLYNHDNEFLHYEDDWYILAAKEEFKDDDFIFVYYKGRNDAWDGYGGAVIYTRSRMLPESIIPQLKEACRKAGLDYNKFTVTDNSCGPELPFFARLENKLENEVIKGEQALLAEVQELEREVEEIGKKEFSLLSGLGWRGLKELEKDEERFLQGLGKEEREFIDSIEMGAQEIEKLFGASVPIRKFR